MIFFTTLLFLYALSNNFFNDFSLVLSVSLFSSPESLGIIYCKGVMKELSEFLLENSSTSIISSFLFPSTVLSTTLSIALLMISLVLLVMLIQNMTARTFLTSLLSWWLCSNIFWNWCYCFKSLILFERFCERLVSTSGFSPCLPDL